MTGRLDGSTVIALATVALFLGPAGFALLRRLGVSTSRAGKVAAGLIAFCFTSLCFLTGALGVRPWEWSGAWGGVELALHVGTETGLWWWPIAGAAYLAYRVDGVDRAQMRPADLAKSAELANLASRGGLVLALASVAWVACAGTPAGVALGLLAFGIGVALGDCGGRMRVVASAVLLAWVVLELGADARAVGIEAPTLDSLADVARPYSREVLLVVLGTVGAVGLIPASLGPRESGPAESRPGDSGPSGPSSPALPLAALALASMALVRVVAPALALGMGEWAQVLAWPALLLLVVAATRQWNGAEHGGVFGVAVALVVLGVGSLGPGALAAANAIPALLAMALVAQQTLRTHPLARAAPLGILAIGGSACFAAIYWSNSTFQTPGVLATLALVGLGIGMAGASRARPAAPSQRRTSRLGGALVLFAFAVGAPGGLAQSSAQRSLDAETIARTRCLRLKSRDTDGLALQRPDSACSEPARVLRTRYRVLGHAAPGGGSQP